MISEGQLWSAQVFQGRALYDRLQSARERNMSKTGADWRLARQQARWIQMLEESAAWELIGC